MAQLFLATRDAQKNVSLSKLDEFLDWMIDKNAAQTTTALADKRVSWMYRGVTLRAQGVASMPFVIESKNGAEIDTSADYQNALAFLPKPKRLLYLLEASRTLAGVSYVFQYRNRIKTTSLEYMPPSAVRPKFSQATGKLTGFEIHTAQGWKFYPRADTGLQDIVYDWMPDAMVGDAPPERFPAQAALSAAGISINLDKFVEAFFARGAIKATILTMKGNPPQPERERIKELWNKITSGIGNAFGTSVWNADAIDTSVVGDGVSDLDNATLSEEQRNKIGAALMIPQTKLFSGGAGGLGGGGVVEQDDLNFLNECLIPECDAIAESLNEQVFAPQGYKLRFTYENLDAFHDDENALATTAQTYNSLINDCSTFEQWEAIAALAGIEYDETQMRKVFALKESRRQATQANMSADTTDATDTETDTQDPNAADAETETEDETTKAAKALERKQYAKWRKTREKEGKPLDGFVFKHLTESEQRMILMSLSVKSIGATSERFKQELTALVNDAWQNGGKIAKDMRALVMQYVEDAVFEGLLEGGYTPDQIDADEYALVAELENEQLQYVDKFAADVKDATDDPAQQDAIRRRVNLWAENIYRCGQRGWAIAQSKRKERIIWNTANDELTCPVCAPLNGKIIEAGKPFAPGIYNEPAHPNCRCTTVVYRD